MVNFLYIVLLISYEMIFFDLIWYVVWFGVVLLVY